MTMFAMIEPPELFVESVLGFDGDGDDGGGLTLTASVENEICTAAMAVVPCGLCEDAPAV